MNENISRIIESPDFDYSKDFEYNWKVMKKYLLESGTYTAEELEEETKKMMGKYEINEKGEPIGT